MPDKTAATLPRAKATLPPRGPVGPSSMVTETSGVNLSSPPVASSKVSPPVAPKRSMALPAGLAVLAIGLVGGLGVAVWNRSNPVTPTATAPVPTPPTPTAEPVPVKAPIDDVGKAVAPAEVASPFEEAPPPRPTRPPPVAPAEVASPFEEAPPPPRPTRVPPVAPRLAGSLSLNTEPWSRVFLGKKSLGDTPLISVPLPAGQHRLRLVNEEEHIDTVIDVTIKANETTVKKIVF